MTASLDQFRSDFIDREAFEREVLRAYADGSAEGRPHCRLPRLPSSPPRRAG